LRRRGASSLILAYLAEPHCRDRIRFAPSKAVAGQHRAAGTVQSPTMSTQAIRDGEITALYAAI
jgi:hypothetical protein